MRDLYLDRLFELEFKRRMISLEVNRERNILKLGNLYCELGEIDKEIYFLKKTYNDGISKILSKKGIYL